MREANSHSGIVLYLTKDGVSPSCTAKMSGIRRYCLSRGWNAELVFREDFPAAELSGILNRPGLVGCVVDGVSNNVNLPPRRFQDIPVTYIGYMRGRTGNRPNFHFNTEAIVETAFRELAASMPPCYAVVGHNRPFRWSRQRVRAFRDIVRASGSKCFSFSSRGCSGDGAWDGFVARLAPWLAKLPEHCAVFAVSDQVAVQVARAARAAVRHIPRSLTLVSVDNFKELCESVEPPISSIQLDFERAGFLAARALGEFVAAKNAKTRKDFAGSASFTDKTTTSAPILIDPLLVVRRKSTSGHGRHEKFIAEAVEIIRREACAGLTVQQLLERFPHSRRNFERRFREARGHSVLDEILSVRLEAATSLLAQTDTAIGAIPDMCGFQSYRALDFHFRSRFKMGMGMWRKRNGR